jgi:outer membrane scaffolding protein for murein synthesis (MipA/OmpV family)
MYKYLVVALASICGSAAAQTPATNLMPDGSRDMYIGVGALSAPRYDGARERHTLAMPVLQVEWSNGLFVAGQSLGMHLSKEPAYEFGPLLALAARRDEDGNSGGLGSVGERTGTSLHPSTILPPSVTSDGNRLTGMDIIHRRLLYGAFFNANLTPQLRLANNLLYGAGNERDGLRLHTALQYMLPDLATHHSLVLSAGVSLVNAGQNRTYFGVTQEEAARTGLAAYRPSGGVQDVRAGVRWNWSVSPSWMLTSGVQLTRLLGDAKDSPLVERPTNLTVTTALAYRF